MIWNRQKYVGYAGKHCPYPNLARIAKRLMVSHTVVIHAKSMALQKRPHQGAISLMSWNSQTKPYAANFVGAALLENCRIVKQ